jgi:CheY-like chemotaxis protein
MIWIVTDEPLTKDELLPLVKERGYEAAHVDCVEDVRKRAKFARPALLIIDCGVRDSFALVTAMREEPLTRDIPLVMFTTSNDAFREEAISRGADAFVLKRSLDWAELLEEIERLAGPAPGLDHPRRP